jgi:hypothetical protein
LRIILICIPFSLIRVNTYELVWFKVNEKILPLERFEFFIGQHDRFEAFLQRLPAPTPLISHIQGSFYAGIL